MVSVTIIGVALLIYAIFWLWYIGFSRTINPELVDQVMDTISASNSALTTDTHRKNFKHFLENDNGKDFVMVNLLRLKRPTAESRKNLGIYSKIFLGGLLKRAGHPVAQAQAAAGKIEFVDIPEEQEWDSAFFVRYRSRKDLAEMLLETAGSEHHNLKIASLERTVAFPASPWFILGGPKLLVPLVLALCASLLHILFV
ncbi:MAG: hypothetical protein ACI8RO_001367 [Flavobacteriales bacterium]|jgi:hypothetical protein